jgi:phosphoribosylaminoimidazole-succinocarboxamide synthase
MTSLVGTTELPLESLRRGKVRDVYLVDAHRLLLVASDRVSAFDVVMRELVPFKGAVLTQITAFWLRHLEDEIAHHMLSADADEIVRLVPALAPHRKTLAGRAMLCRRTEVFPVECVVRGYLSGSAWKEYREKGTLAGEHLPPGLVESDRFEEPIFSPSTKAEVGHDENITIERMRAVLGSERATELERLSRRVYSRGRDLAAQRGIIIADTKFEFGLDGAGTLTLMDEVLTPDSSRFWPADEWKPGTTPPSFDKQPVRDFLDGLDWNKQPPPPTLPDDVIKASHTRYVEAYERITGRSLADWPGGA